MNSATQSLMNPYPGLVPFEEQDAARFFGRDREIEDVLDRLSARQLLAVIGVSGCGKSSLVRAGVIPVLRMGVANNLPAKWRIHMLSPGATPLKSLARAVGAGEGEDWPKSSFDLIDRAKQILTPGENLLVVVDQFEELLQFRTENFARDGGNESALFANLLLNAIDQREVPVYVLLTMRTDFLGECAKLRGLPEALNDCYYLVPRMTRMQQQDAIQEPLREYGVSMQAGLVQKVLNDSEEDPDHLPVLQHLLKRLWEHWSADHKDRRIGLEDYDAIGGWANALNNEAESVLDRFSPCQDGVRRVFQWITEIGPGEKPIRRPRPFSECVHISGLGPESLAEIIREFQDKQVLRHCGLTDQSRIDLPHESVMWQWSRLRQWIVEETARAANVRFLFQSARQQNLLTGLALDSGLEFRSECTGDTLSAERYLASDELEQTLSWIDSSEQTAMLQRNSTEARELSAWAAVSLTDDPERTLILGLHAWHKQGAMPAGLEQFLHDGLLQSQCRLTIGGYGGYVRGIAWSRDGSKLAASDDTGMVKIWDCGQGRGSLTIESHEGVAFGLVWSPDDTKLATSGADGTAKIWDAATGEHIRDLSGHKAPVDDVTWSPDGTRIATASRDQTACVWEAQTGHCVLVLTAPQPVFSVAWSPDGLRLITACKDGTARIWDARTGAELLTVEADRNQALRAAWSPDGKTFATCGIGQSAKIWDADSGELRLELSGHQLSVYAAEFSPTGIVLATASGDHTVRLWSTSTGRELLVLRGHQGPVWRVAWRPPEAGSYLATGSADGKLKVWEASLGKEQAWLPAGESVTDMAWSPDGKTLALAADENVAKLWDPQTGAFVTELRGHESGLGVVAWSPDGTRLLTCSNDGEAKIWDREGTEVLARRIFEQSVSSGIWSPDGNSIVTAAASGMIRVWDARGGQELLSIEHGDDVYSLAWSPDGTRIASAGADASTRIWDVGTGAELFQLLDHTNSIFGVMWSPDGSRLATGGADGLLVVWDAVTGGKLETIHAHPNFVWAVAWSPDGTRIATGGGDHTAKVWAADTGRQLLTLRGQTGSVRRLVWSPDGMYLAAGSEDGNVQIYIIDTSALLRLVSSRVTRNLSMHESRQYLNTEEIPPLPDVP